MEEDQQAMRKLGLKLNTSSDFIYTFETKNKNTSNKKLKQVENKIGSDFKLYRREKISSTKSAIVKSKPKRWTQWVAFVHKLLPVPMLAPHAKGVLST